MDLMEEGLSFKEGMVEYCSRVFSVKKIYVKRPGGVWGCEGGLGALPRDFLYLVLLSCFVCNVGILLTRTS